MRVQGCDGVDECLDLGENIQCLRTTLFNLKVVFIYIYTILTTFQFNSYFSIF